MKTTKRLLAIAAALVMLCAFAGCNKNDGETAASDTAVSVQSEADMLVGQWQSEKLSNYVYTFNADGSGQYDMAGNILELNYTAEDGKLTLEFTQEGYSPVTLNYELDGDRLNIKDSYGKDTFYVRVKE